MRSLSPSLIFVWTRTVSPDRIGGMSFRNCLASISAIALRSMMAPLQLVVPGVDEPEIGIVQPEAFEQVRPSRPRGPERLAPPPPLDALVVAGDQDLRHLH